MIVVTRKLVFYLSVIVCISNVATAQTLHFSAKNWRVFTSLDQGKKVCYMASVPVNKTGNYRKRGEPFVLVMYQNNGSDEVSVSSGYPYKDGSSVDIRVDNKSYSLFTKAERAWAREASTDSALIGQMIKGNKLIVKGHSKLGTYSQDSYSLSGFTSAYKKMNSLCK